MKIRRMRAITAVGILVVLFAAGAGADEANPSGSDAGLAQDLTNPLADLITVPIQMNVDRNIGQRDKGRKIQTNIQPVYPVSLTEDWNMITRTIIPVIDQKDIFAGAGSQFGLGDATISLFVSPRKPTSSGIIWGVGPVFYLPTATDHLLGAEKWGAGPTAVCLTMRGPWTLGALGNHVWSYAGDNGRPDLNNTFMQPFAAYTWPSGWTVSAQSESSYNWETEKWAIPLNVAAAKLVWVGRLPVSLSAGIGYWLESTATGPEGFRFRLQANFVLPKP